jgi:N utilization substance protein B
MGSENNNMNAGEGKDAAARRVALWLLWAADVTGRPGSEVLLESYSTAIEVEPKVASRWKEVEARVQGVSDRIQMLNEQVQAVSPRWKLERMASIDRNILRLGAWEILTNHRSPIVVINACVELGKLYGEKDTPGFINGLLDQLCKNHKIKVS